MSKNQLLPENISYLLNSDEVTDEELQIAHRRLDYEIMRAECTRSFLTEDIDEAKKYKLLLKKKMNRRGIKPKKFKRSHLRSVA